MTHLLLVLGHRKGQSSALSPRAKRVVERILEKGVVVTLAPGRVFGSALPFVQELGIRYPLKRPLVKWTIPLALAHRFIAVAGEAGLKVSPIWAIASTWKARTLGSIPSPSRQV